MWLDFIDMIWQHEVINSFVTELFRLFFFPVEYSKNVHGGAAVAQFVEWSPIESRVSSLSPNSSWPYVEVSQQNTEFPSFTKKFASM